VPFVARLFLVVIALSSIGLPALAQTVSRTSLHRDCILGDLTSTSVMNDRVRYYNARLARAAELIGLTAAEYRAWRSQILYSQSIAYVEVPHHLDAMTGLSTRHGGIYMVRNTDLPSGYGWEVDLDEPNRTLALYLTDDCGNLSLLTKPGRVVAVATPRPPLPLPFHESWSPPLPARPPIPSLTLTPVAAGSAPPAPVVAATVRASPGSYALAPIRQQ